MSPSTSESEKQQSSESESKHNESSRQDESSSDEASMVGDIKSAEAGDHEYAGASEKKVRAKSDKLTYKFTDGEIAGLRRELKLSVEIAGGLLEFGIAVHSLLVKALDAAGYGELFTTPAKVLAFQFVRTVDSLMNVIDRSEIFDNQLYNLAMRHINYVPIKVMIQLKENFIGALNAGLASFLEDQWTEADNEMWVKFWGYCGDHIIHTLGEIGGRVLVLRRSWNAVSLLRNDDLSGGFGDAFYFNMGVMSAEAIALVKTSRTVFGRNLNGGFDVLVKSSSDPAVFTEELFVLGTRHQTYGVQDKHFAIFAQAILVTLRTLLPKEWDKNCEQSWTWFFGVCAEGMVKNLEDAAAYREMLVTCYEKVGQEIDIVSLGSLYYENFFTGNPAAQIFFNKPKTLIQILVSKACDLLINIYIDGTETTRLIRALGIRHIKYGIPPEHFPSFGSALVVTFAEVLEGYWDDHVELGWKTVFEFTSNCMARSVYSGTTLLTRALMRDSSAEIEEALDQAPRVERSLWMLEIDVSGIKVSPFFWGIQDAKYVVCTFMLKDILTIRADREKYYCGKDELFRVHRDITEICSSNSVDLLLVMFDGLCWECAKVENGRRKVNYYLKDLYGDPHRKIYENPYNTPLNTLVATRDDRPFAHPLVSQLIEMQWALFGRVIFIRLQVAYLAGAVFFLLGYIFLDRKFVAHEGSHQAKNIFAFVCRVLCVLVFLCMFVFSQLPRIRREIRLRQTTRIHIPLLVCDLDFDIPKFFAGIFNVLRVFLILMLLVSIAFDQEFDIWLDHEDQEVDTDIEHLAWNTRSWTVGFSSIFVLLQMFEACDFSLEWSKLKQRCNMIMGNFLIFLLMLNMIAMAFAVAIWSSEPKKGFGKPSEMFATVGRGFVSLLHTLYGIYSFHVDSGYSNQMYVYHILYAFVVLLMLARLALGMFVESSVRNYLKLGRFAYMGRGGMLIELNSIRTVEERKDEWVKLALDQRIEFDDGDLGLTGGISVMEDVSSERMRHDRIIGDRIIRFVGVCADRLPWPKIKAIVVGAEEICGRIDVVINDIYRDLKSVQRRFQGDSDNTNTGTGGGTGVEGGSNSSDH